MTALTLFHGSSRVVAHPSLAQGRMRNDFGQGFYTTSVHELACEWACQRGLDGFVSTYSLWTDGLNVLDLLDGTHNTLEWVALLLKYRQFDLRLPTAALARAELVERFCPDLTRLRPHEIPQLLL